MELPAKILKFDHLDRGRKRKFLIQNRLVEVIRENKEPLASGEADLENDLAKKHENWKNSEPKAISDQIKNG